MTVKTNRNRQHTKSNSPQSLQHVFAEYFFVCVLSLSILITLFPDVLSHSINFVIKVVEHTPIYVLLDHSDDIAEHSIDHAGYALNTVSTLDVDLSFLEDLPHLLPASGASSGSDLAPLFTEEIHYWGDDIMRWATQYNLDPNLMATVMQIESCGHPTIGSSAGAQGLFQVMPFHFSSAENQHDPDTNAMRSAGVLNQCLVMANGDAGMAMACYNGGPSVLSRSYNNWAAETQRYYYWGTGIYEDAQHNRAQSDRLDEWLSRASGLCDLASAEIGLN